MKNIYLNQSKGLFNGHIFISKSGEVTYNDNEFDILNFIFSNGIDAYEPIIIEYELNAQNELTCLKELVELIKPFIEQYNFNPFLNVRNLNEIIDIPNGENDYFVKYSHEFEKLKTLLVNKEKYLLGYSNHDDTVMNFKNTLISDSLTDEEISRIKDIIIKSLNINKTDDADWAKPQIENAFRRGLIKTHHESNEIVTMGSLITILNRMNRY